MTPTDHGLLMDKAAQREQETLAEKRESVLGQLSALKAGAKEQAAPTPAKKAGRGEPVSRQQLSLAEQETIILWDNGLDTAEVYTHDQRLLNKLRGLSRQFPENFVRTRTGPGRSETYRIPKRCVGVRPRTVSGAGNSSGRTHSGTACPL